VTAFFNGCTFFTAAVFQHVYGLGFEINVAGGTAVFDGCVFFLSSGLIIVGVNSISYHEVTMMSNLVSLCYSSGAQVPFSIWVLEW